MRLHRRQMSNNHNGYRLRIGNQMRVSQIELISAICKHLDKQGVKTMVPRQYNAVIAAADCIIEAIAREPVPATPGMGLHAWLACDEAGLSSQYMASILGGFEGRREYAHPLDADDFSRCVKLLDAVPEYRKDLEKMRDKSDHWSQLLDRWDVAEKAYREGNYDVCNMHVASAVGRP